MRKRNPAIGRVGVTAEVGEKTRRKTSNTSLHRFFEPLFRVLFIHYPLAGLLIALILVTSIFKPLFLSPTNLLNTLNDASTIGIIGIGMTFVIIAKGIDLSVGSTVALTCVGMAMLDVRYGVPVWGSIALVLLMGAGIGLIIGMLVTLLKIPAFISSLGMMFALLGLARQWCGAQAYGGFPDYFTLLWSGRIGLPVPVLIWLAIMIIGVVVERLSKFGRYCYAIGGDVYAAHFMGIRIYRTVIMTFVLTGLFSAIAGILLAARFNSGEPLAGRGYEFLVITAVVAGGTSLLGGRGTIVGTLVGALIISFLRTIMSFWGLAIYYQHLGVGVLLIVMVWWGMLRRRTEKPLS